jgi:hypothetical protein
VADGLVELDPLGVAAGLVLGEGADDLGMALGGDALEGGALGVDAQELVVGAGAEVAHDLTASGARHRSSSGRSAWFTWGGG